MQFVAEPCGSKTDYEASKLHESCTGGDGVFVSPPQKGESNTASGDKSTITMVTALEKSQASFTLLRIFISEI